MAAITWFEVEQFAPELGNGKVTPLAQQMLVDTANTIIASPAWGVDGSPTLRMGRLLWIAHFATLELRKGQAGASTSKSMGGMSESFAVPPMTNSLMEQTSYGQLYLTLAKTRAFRGGFTTGMVKR